MLKFNNNGNFQCPCCGEHTLDKERCWSICSNCLWEDCSLQFDNPDFSDGVNGISLNRARKRYKKNGRPVRDINTIIKKKKKCACCGNLTLDKDSRFDICRICWWQDDAIQNDDPDYDGGANHMSLNEARQAYKEGRKVI